MTNAKLKVKVETIPVREDERLHILMRATKKMKKGLAIDSNLDLGVIAAQTKNYNRPELELLIRLAQGNALSAQLLRNGGVPTIEGLKLSMTDFITAMSGIKSES